MRYLLLSLILTGCSIVEEAPLDLGVDINPVVDYKQPSWNTGGSVGGSLPPGFMIRGCAYDRPCEGPMPGDKIGRPVQ